MTTHSVKSWTHLFKAAVEGKKSHDIRDGTERNYEVGDQMVFNEFDYTTGKYTGQRALFEITYITSNSTPCALSPAVLKPGYMILSIELKEIL
jgi:hypothetical protein